MGVITAIKERQKEAKLKLLRTSLYNKFKEQITLYEGKIVTKNSDIETFIKRIVVDQRDIENFSGYVNTLREQLKDLDKKMTIVYDQLKVLENGNMFKKINIGEDKIEAFTKLIEIRQDHKVYEIGEFRIDLDFKGIVRMHNITRKIDGCYDHPHIRNGEVCWGNASGGIARLIGKSHFRDVLKLCYEFLVSPALNHVYAGIDNWKGESR